MTAATCPGTCCQYFTLSASYRQLHDDRFIGGVPKRFEEDAIKIWDMIVPHQDPDYYQCRFFNVATRRCENYDGRPDMCKRHPNYGSGSRVCEHCSYDTFYPDLPGVPWRPVAETGIFPVE